MAARPLDIEVKVEMESLSRQVFEQMTRLKELNDTMSTIAATRRLQEQLAEDALPAFAEEEFDLSTLDYDGLLEVYGDDPVLLTILNRMRKFFKNGQREPWYKIKDWPGSSPFVTDPNGYFRWDTSGTITTTSTVSEPFTVKYDSTGGSYTLSTTTPDIRYTIEED